ncbi:MAG: hypothetical protein K1X67_01925 [Fimbriimonadaceae bacterium]|nr:hypothetical protein [Fimbriimonadaceae bacterium]
MKPLRLAVLGIGSVRCAPPIIGALASYFGDQDLEVRLYDEDAERLDLFDRLARRCFAVEKAKHLLIAVDDVREALEGADMVILAIGENCARRFLKKHTEKGKGKKVKVGASREEVMRAALDSMMRSVPDGAPVLDLTRGTGPRPDTHHLDWPAELSEIQRQETPFQVLRWIRAEDLLGPLIDAHRRSPIKDWIDASSPNAHE